MEIAIAITRLDNGGLVKITSFGGTVADRHDSGCLLCGAGPYLQHKANCPASGLQRRVEWRKRVSRLSREQFDAICAKLKSKNVA
jgi:ribosomal protein L37E